MRTTISTMAQDGAKVYLPPRRGDEPPWFVSRIQKKVKDYVEAPTATQAEREIAKLRRDSSIYESIRDRSAQVKDAVGTLYKAKEHFKATENRAENIKVDSRLAQLQKDLQILQSTNPDIKKAEDEYFIGQYALSLPGSLKNKPVIDTDGLSDTILQVTKKFEQAAQKQPENMALAKQILQLQNMIDAYKKGDNIVKQLVDTYVAEHFHPETSIEKSPKPMMPENLTNKKKGMQDAFKQLIAKNKAAYSNVSKMSHKNGIPVLDENFNFVNYEGESEKTTQSQAPAKKVERILFDASDERQVEILQRALIRSGYWAAADKEYYAKTGDHLWVPGVNGVPYGNYKDATKYVVRFYKRNAQGQKNPNDFVDNATWGELSKAEIRKYVMDEDGDFVNWEGEQEGLNQGREIAITKSSAGFDPKDKKKVEILQRALIRSGYWAAADKEYYAKTGDHLWVPGVNGVPYGNYKDATKYVIKFYKREAQNQENPNDIVDNMTWGELNQSDTRMYVAHEKGDGGSNRSIRYLGGTSIQNVPDNILREITSIGTGFLPIVGDIKDIQEVVTGYDIVAGKQLTWVDRGITFACVFLPIVNGKAVREVVGLADEGIEIAKGISKSMDEGVEAISKHADEAARGAGSKIGKLDVIDGKVGGKVPVEDYTALRESSVKNPSSNSLTLGKYADDATSYTKRAEDTSYFDMGDDWGATRQKYNLSGDEMFEYFNKPVLDDAISSSKTIRFTHNPLDYSGSFLADEWGYLKNTLNLTDSSLYFEGGFWYVRLK